MPINISLLYVEDEDIVRDGVSEMLARMVKHNFTNDREIKIENIYTAANGKEGFEKYEKYNPEIIITDIRMPVMDGLEMSKLIKEKNKDIQIIVTTAFNDVEFFIRSIDIGVNQYVIKPIEREKLFYALERAYDTVINNRKLKEQDALIRKLHTALEQSMSEIIITDTDGNIEYINPNVSEVTGYKSEELIGKNVIELSDDTSDGDPEKIWNNVRNGINWYGELCGRRKYGDKYWELAEISQIKDRNGLITGFMKIAEDITDRKAMEAELQKAKEEAENLNQLKSDFIANVSHEIRTPINGVIGMLDLIAENDLNPQIFKYVSMARSSADVLLHIINDILDFSKIEAGKLEIEYIDFYIEDLIENVYDAFHMQAIEKGVEFKCICDENIPPMLIGDSHRIRQILINLVGNSLKFTTHGVILLSVTFLEKTDGKVKLKFSVKDTGIGIPKEKLELLFRSFSQTDVSISRKYGGTGLGLAISKKLTELMKGSIYVESQEGYGSNFYFILDFEISRKNPDEIKQNKITKKNFNIQEGINILIAEDNVVNMELAVELLKKLKANVYSAKNGLEAINYFEGDNIDIIFMDGQMPEMDGIEATKRIRKKEETTGKHVPIIAMTGYSMKGDKEKFIQAGMDEYIPKPVDKYRLYEIIEKYVSKDRDVSEKIIINEEPDIELSEEEKAIQRLVDKYKYEYPGLLERIESAIKINDFDELAAAAHKLKGMIVSLGIEKAGEMCKNLEYAGKNKNLDEGDKIFRDMYKEITSYDTEKIKDFIRKNII